jgi:hypothetical protein
VWQHRREESRELFTTGLHVSRLHRASYISGDPKPLDGPEGAHSSITTVQSVYRFDGRTCHRTYSRWSRPRPAAPLLTVRTLDPPSIGGEPFLIVPTDSAERAGTCVDK